MPSPKGFTVVQHASIIIRVGAAGLVLVIVAGYSLACAVSSHRINTDRGAHRTARAARRTNDRLAASLPVRLAATSIFAGIALTCVGLLLTGRN